MVPSPRLSRSSETLQVITAALAFNTAILSLYVALRLVTPLGDHSPSPADLVASPSSYISADDTRFAWLLVWAIMFLLASSALAYATARRLWLPPRIVEKFVPAVKQTPAWHEVFHNWVPQDSRVLIVAYLTDGTVIGGKLAWYNADTDETAERDIVLAPPILQRPPDGEQKVTWDEQRVVVAARNVRYMQVIYQEQ